MKKYFLGIVMAACAMGAQAELGQTYEGTITSVSFDTRQGSSNEGGMIVVVQIPSALSAGCDAVDNSVAYAYGSITAASSHFDRLLSQATTAHTQAMNVSIEVDLQDDCRLMQIVF